MSLHCFVTNSFWQRLWIDRNYQALGAFLVIWFETFCQSMDAVLVALVSRMGIVCGGKLGVPTRPGQARAGQWGLFTEQDNITGVTASQCDLHHGTVLVLIPERRLPHNITLSQDGASEGCLSAFVESSNAAMHPASLTYSTQRNISHRLNSLKENTLKSIKNWISPSCRAGNHNISLNQFRYYRLIFVHIVLQLMLV